jgi:predicted deacylase
MEIAKLHNTAELKIPIIVRRSKIDGPVVLFSRVHGDEINGVVRQLITKKLINLKRNHHLYSVINMFGFLNKRNFLMAET